MKHYLMARSRICGGHLAKGVGTTLQLVQDHADVDEALSNSSVATRMLWIVMDRIYQGQSTADVNQAIKDVSKGQKPTQPFGAHT